MHHLESMLLRDPPQNRFSTVSVKLRHGVMSAARLLFHRNRKSIGDLAMSHKCHDRGHNQSASTSSSRRVALCTSALARARQRRFSLNGWTFSLAIPQLQGARRNRLRSRSRKFSTAANIEVSFTPRKRNWKFARRTILPYTQSQRCCCPKNTDRCPKKCKPIIRV